MRTRLFLGIRESPIRSAFAELTATADRTMLLPDRSSYSKHLSTIFPPACPKPIIASFIFRTVLRWEKHNHEGVIILLVRSAKVGASGKRGITENRKTVTGRFQKSGIT